jgi:hypothetical protein
MELAQYSTNYTMRADRRPRMPEPPPVRLVTVDDAHMPARAGVEPQLDEFYVGLLEFEREADSNYPIYRAGNFRILFDVLEPPVRRDHLRALGIEVRSLNEAGHKLLDSQIEYARRRGLLPGQETLVLLDPAGNWIEIRESRELH